MNRFIQNYRIDLTNEETREKIADNDWQPLWEADQVKSCYSLPHHPTSPDIECMTSCGTPWYTKTRLTDTKKAE
jgi:hypothetical protein